MEAKDWEVRTTYTMRIGRVECVVESPDLSGWCRIIVRVYDGIYPQVVHHGNVHGLRQAKAQASAIAEGHSKVPA